MKITSRLPHNDKSGNGVHVLYGAEAWAVVTKREEELLERTGMIVLRCILGSLAEGQDKGKERGRP